VNAGESLNSSSPAIHAAIDKRIIQDSRLFSFSFLFSILLFFHHDDFTSVEIEFPLNGVKGKIDQVLLLFIAAERTTSS
jgi:hypothetical protein